MGLLTQYKPESKYLKAEDLAAHGWEWVLKIKAIGEATFDDGRKQPTLEFFETDKVLGLNRTNLETLAELFGKPNAHGVMDVEPNDLSGRIVSAYKTQTRNSGGTMVDCVRLRMPRIDQFNQAVTQPAPVVSSPAYTPEQYTAADEALKWLDSRTLESLQTEDGIKLRELAAKVGAELTGVKGVREAARRIRTRADSIAATLTVVVKPGSDDIPF